MHVVVLQVKPCCSRSCRSRTAGCVLTWARRYGRSTATPVERYGCLLPPCLPVTVLWSGTLCFCCVVGYHEIFMKQSKQKMYFSLFMKFMNRHWIHGFISSSHSKDTVNKFKGYNLFTYNLRLSDLPAKPMHPTVFCVVLVSMPVCVRNSPRS